jgi:hypothetical protein
MVEASGFHQLDELLVVVIGNNFNGDLSHEVIANDFIGEKDGAESSGS